MAQEMALYDEMYASTEILECIGIPSAQTNLWNKSVIGPCLNQSENGWKRSSEHP